VIRRAVLVLVLVALALANDDLLRAEMLLLIVPLARWGFQPPGRFL